MRKRLSCEQAMWGSLGQCCLDSPGWPFFPLSRRLCVCIVVNVGNGVALSVLMGTTYHMLGTNLSSFFVYLYMGHYK